MKKPSYTNHLCTSNINTDRNNRSNLPSTPSTTEESIGQSMKSMGISATLTKRFPNLPPSTALNSSPIQVQCQVRHPYGTVVCGMFHERRFSKRCPTRRRYPRCPRNSKVLIRHQQSFLSAKPRIAQHRRRRPPRHHRSPRRKCPHWLRRPSRMQTSKRR